MYWSDADNLLYCGLWSHVEHFGVLYPDGELPNGVAAKLARIKAAIEALRLQEYRKQDLAQAGAFVMLAQDGSIRVERGFIRPENEPKKAKDEAGGEGGQSDGPQPLSEKLVAELTAHRTAALRNELALRPETALLAVIHALALAAFYNDREASCVEVVAKRTWLSSHAPGIDEARAETQIAVWQDMWAKRLPKDQGELWAFLKGLSEADRLLLLAHCVSFSVNALQVRGHGAEALAHADLLAEEVSLDMTAYWQPTAANYFARVSKDRIVEALRESGAEHVEATARLKKAAMAEAAEAAVGGEGWLPTVLRAA